MTGCLHLIHSAEGFHACRLRAGPKDTLVLMRPSALPASLPPTRAGAAHLALHWLDAADPGAEHAALTAARKHGLWAVAGAR